MRSRRGRAGARRKSGQGAVRETETQQVFQPDGHGVRRVERNVQVSQPDGDGVRCVERRVQVKARCGTGGAGVETVGDRQEKLIGWGGQESRRGGQEKLIDWGGQESRRLVVGPVGPRTTRHRSGREGAGSGRGGFPFFWSGELCVEGSSCTSVEFAGDSSGCCPRGGGGGARAATVSRSYLVLVYIATPTISFTFRQHLRYSYQFYAHAEVRLIASRLTTNNSTLTEFSRLSRFSAVCFGSLLMHSSTTRSRSGRSPVPTHGGL